jgi:nucleoside 2-deoxyribosyltransferase
MRIYMAGPLFSTAECEFNKQLAAALRENGHEIFLPQEHEQRADRPDLIFKSDKEGIDWCQLVLANLDGPDPDSGTCWELGYGYGTDKYIICYRTDFRLFEGADKVNLMMTESANLTLYVPKMDVQELADRIDFEIRHRFEAHPKLRPMRADQFGGFNREPEKYVPFDDGVPDETVDLPTGRYRHADK